MRSGIMTFKPVPSITRLTLNVKNGVFISKETKAKMWGRATYREKNGMFHGILSLKDERYVICGKHMDAPDESCQEWVGATYDMVEECWVN